MLAENKIESNLNITGEIQCMLIVVTISYYRSSVDLTLGLI